MFRLIVGEHDRDAPPWIPLQMPHRRFCRSFTNFYMSAVYTPETESPKTLRDAIYSVSIDKCLRFWYKVYMRKILGLIAIIVGLTLTGVSAYMVARPVEPKATPVKVVVQEDKYAGGPPEIMEMLELVNKERAKVGVAPLVIDPKLNESAQMKADDMFTYKYFGHENHDGTRGGSYIRTVGAACSVGSENITDNVTEEDNNSMQSVYNWVHSSPHYKAMIDSKYISTGFGVSGTKIVEHFCVPR